MRHLKPLLSVLCLGVLLAFAADALKVDDLIKSADKHDGKAVTVVGTVTEFTQKTSRAGNKYFTFKLKGKTPETALSVYGRGEPQTAPKKDDKVEVTGIYRKEKKLPSFTVKNEVDISAVEGKKYGLKILKD